MRRGSSPWGMGPTLCVPSASSSPPPVTWPRSGSRPARSWLRSGTTYGDEVQLTPDLWEDLPLGADVMRCNPPGGAVFNLRSERRRRAGATSQHFIRGPRRLPTGFEPRPRARPLRVGPALRLIDRHPAYGSGSPALDARRWRRRSLSAGAIGSPPPPARIAPRVYPDAPPPVRRSQTPRRTDRCFHRSSSLAQAQHFVILLLLTALLSRPPRSRLRQRHLGSLSWPESPCSARALGRGLQSRDPRWC